MPSYDGVQIFGSAVVMQAAVVNPFRIQQNVFPGLSGSEELRHGQDGAFTMVTGRLGGFGLNGLAQQEALFRSYADGISRILIDTLGDAWPEVKLESFVPHDRVVTDPNTGYCWRAYTARFKHIVW